MCTNVVTACMLIFYRRCCVNSKNVLMIALNGNNTASVSCCSPTVRYTNPPVDLQTSARLNDIDPSISQPRSSSRHTIRNTFPVTEIWPDGTTMILPWIYLVYFLGEY